jgi:hypothetical protein
MVRISTIDSLVDSRFPHQDYKFNIYLAQVETVVMPYGLALNNSTSF